MKLAMHLLETALIHMGVDLSRGDVGMTQHLLDDTEVSTIIQEVGGKGMPQEVRVNVFVYPCRFSTLLNDLFHSGWGQD